MPADYPPIVVRIAFERMEAQIAHWLDDEHLTEAIKAAVHEAIEAVDMAYEVKRLVPQILHERIRHSVERFLLDEKNANLLTLLIRQEATALLKDRTP